MTEAQRLVAALLDDGAAYDTAMLHRAIRQELAAGADLETAKERAFLRVQGEPEPPAASVPKQRPVPLRTVQRLRASQTAEALLREEVCDYCHREVGADFFVTGEKVICGSCHIGGRDADDDPRQRGLAQAYDQSPHNFSAVTGLLKRRRPPLHFMERPQRATEAIKPAPKGPFNKAELEKGTAEEMEHTTDRPTAARIAKQHLKPQGPPSKQNYYRKLKKYVEPSAKAVLMALAPSSSSPASP